MIVIPDRDVILASASPRRKELLSRLGLDFKVLPPHIDESMLPDEKPVDYTRRISEAKGNAIARSHADKIIISSDTAVVYKEHILGKPVNGEDAVRMLKLLSGRTHQVVSAFSLICRDLKIAYTDHEITDVQFRDLSEKEILSYIASGSPMDKAGAYGIQDLSANFVKSINGCYYNVIGFPVARFKKAWDSLFS